MMIEVRSREYPPLGRFIVLGLRDGRKDVCLPAMTPACQHLTPRIVAQAGEKAFLPSFRRIDD